MIGLKWYEIHKEWLIKGVMIPKRPFAASHSRGTKPPCWRVNVALGHGKQKIYMILNGYFLCLSCPCATFALQHGGFVPREWQAAKGLLGTMGTWLNNVINN